jgi:uncharacterized protein (DUF2236 family)
VRTSILGRVNGERLVVLGWSRAILMQLAHPLMAAGVAKHSKFRGGAADAAIRLHHTVSAMVSLIFGDEDNRAAAVARIRAIHRTVRGTLDHAAGPFPAGTPYSAEDPQLLHWVHVTLIDSTAVIYDQLVAPLSAADRDQLCEESTSTLLELGGEADAAPRSWGALRGDIDRMAAGGALVVTPEGRAIADAVLSPRAAGLPVPCVRWHRLVTIGLLPAFIREAYGFAWEARQESSLRRVLGVIRTARRVTPEGLARWRSAR